MPNIELTVTEDSPIELSVLSDTPVLLGVQEQINATYNDLSPALKQAFLQLAEHIAYIDADGQDYYDALYDALYPVTPPAELVSISAVYTQSGTVYDTDTLDDLKPDLVVTAHYDDSTEAAVTAYTLSGTLTEGTSTITVSYSGKTTTFNVTVSLKWTFEWDYTKGLPNNNGMTVTNTSGTVSLESNGLSVSTANSSSSLVSYRYEDVSPTPWSKTITELVATFKAFSQQSGSGIRSYAGLGGTSTAVLKPAQLLFSQNGIQYLGSVAGWSTFSADAFVVDTEYTIRIEQVSGSADIYINGTKIGTLTENREQVAYPQFGVYRGVSALIKSFKIRYDV